MNIALHGSPFEDARPACLAGGAENSSAHRLHRGLSWAVAETPVPLGQTAIVTEHQGPDRGGLRAQENEIRKRPGITGAFLLKQ